MDSKRVTFRPFDCHSDVDCSLMAKWENDPAIRELFQVFRDEDALKRVSTPQEVSKNYAPSSDNPTEKSFIIELDGVPVGEMNFFLDRRPIMTPLPNTAWVGIVIGEEHSRSCGVGSLALRKLETFAQAAGAQRIELGVFEFNQVALNFYKKMGYQEIARLPDYTFAKGRKWADIRMLKELTKAL